jgi:hypothetical protein
MRCLEIIELFLLKSGRLSVKHGCVMEMIERFILAGIPHGKGKVSMVTLLRNKHSAQQIMTHASTVANTPDAQYHHPIRAISSPAVIMSHPIEIHHQQQAGPVRLTVWHTSLLPCFFITETFPAQQIREQSLRCLGLCMLLDLEFARQYLSTVIAPLTVDIDGVKVLCSPSLYNMRA